MEAPKRDQRVYREQRNFIVRPLPAATSVAAGASIDVSGADNGAAP